MGFVRGFRSRSRVSRPCPDKLLPTRLIGTVKSNRVGNSGYSPAGPGMRAGA
jgi:hypothetical protein